MSTTKELKQKKERRVLRMRRTRAKIRGTTSKPRLSIFRSNAHVYAQIINDETGKTLFGMRDDSMDKEKKLKKSETATSRAASFGELFGKEAYAKGIRAVVFDRSHYAYHGRVKAFAEGARKGGLQF